ncbi:MAG: hypothetical protein WAL04_03425 [Acidimicrobiales bacterium]
MNPAFGGAPSRSHGRRRLALAAAIAAVCFGTGACSSGSRAASSPHESTTSSRVPSSSTVTMTTVRYSGYVTIKGKKVGIPEEGTTPISLVENVGEQIIITPSRIEPHLLFAQVDYRLTFTNLTSAPQRLRFVNDGNWRSPAIPPGGTWHYTPRDGISYYFVTSTGLQATFQASPAGAP